MNNEKNPKVVYRYNAKVIVGIIGLLLLSMPLVANIIENANASQNKFSTQLQEM